MECLCREGMRFFTVFGSGTATKSTSAEAVWAGRVCRAACPVLYRPAGFLAGHDRTRPVAVTAHDVSGGRFW